MFDEDICKFLTINISKLNFWLVICIAKNLIWTTLKMIFSIFRFLRTLRFQIFKYCPNHTSFVVQGHISYLHCLYLHMAASRRLGEGSCPGSPALVWPQPVSVPDVPPSQSYVLPDTSADRNSTETTLWGDSPLKTTHNTTSLLHFTLIPMKRKYNGAVSKYNGGIHHKHKLLKNMNTGMYFEACSKYKILGI